MFLLMKAEGWNCARQVMLIKITFVFPFTEKVPINWVFLTFSVWRFHNWRPSLPELYHLFRRVSKRAGLFNRDMYSRVQLIHFLLLPLLLWANRTEVWWVSVLNIHNTPECCFYIWISSTWSNSIIILTVISEWVFLLSIIHDSEQLSAPPPFFLTENCSASVHTACWDEWNFWGDGGDRLDRRMWHSSHGKSSDGSSQDPERFW